MAIDIIYHNRILTSIAKTLPSYHSIIYTAIGIIIVYSNDFYEILGIELTEDSVNRDYILTDSRLPKFLEDKIISLFNGEDIGLMSIPIELKGTEFQKKVWQELQKIPYGTTLSYSEIAQNIGKPRSYRAVANACGKNILPLIIPCHRAVCANGDVGGFRWGINMKTLLLNREEFNIKDWNR